MATINLAGQISPADIGSLYDQYAPAVLGLITPIFADKTKARGILMKMFCNLPAEIVTPQPAQRPLLLLLNLARNQCVSQLVQDNESTSPAGVMDYINTLPVLEKTIFTLAYFRGFTKNDLAVLLHLPPGKIEAVFTSFPHFTPPSPGSPSL